MMHEIQLTGSLAARSVVLRADLFGGTFKPVAPIRPWLSPPTEERSAEEVAESAAEASAEAVAGVSAETSAEVSAEQFRGRLEVANLTTPWPEQNFTVVCPAHNQCLVEGDAPYPWPRLKLDLEVDSERRPKAIRGVHLDPAGSTVEAEIFYTRVEAAFILNGFCILRDLDKGTDFKFKVRAKETGWFVTRSILYRKLKFLEEFFGVRFAVPEFATVGDALRIGTVFRGVTEGEFTARRQDLTVAGYAPAAGELDQPPFTAPGAFSHTSNAGIQIYDQLLDVGPVEARAERAVATNKRLIKRLHSGELPSADLRLLVFDHQVSYRFSDYVGRTEEIGLRLDAFRKQLSREEPPAMVELLTAQIEEDVSADEAKKIAVGWLQFYNFPDRYWPQTPVLEGGRWRVPIWVTYPNAGGAPVEDVFVDARTGQLTASVSVEEMLERGGSVAASLLRAG